MKQSYLNLQRVTAIAMLAAMSYVVFTFLQIKISLPGGDATSIHLGNAVCVLGALLMGGLADVTGSWDLPVVFLLAMLAVMWATSLWSARDGYLLPEE